MLWTDGYVITIDDLAAIDPEVVDVAAMNNITVTGENGVIDKTLQEVSADLTAQMQRFGGYLSSGQVSGNHLAAVHNVGGPAANRARVLMNQIVSKWPDLPPVYALRNWITYRTLANFFRMASNRVQTPRERFQEKMKEYKSEVKFVYWPTLQANGLPVVYRPLMSPGAAFELNAGRWTASAVAGSTTTGGQFDVAITYLDSDYYVNPSRKNNSESFISDKQTLTVAPNSVISVDITYLNPPDTSIQDPYVPLTIVTPLNASAWNVYAGPTGGVLTLQNSSPIPIATKQWTLPSDPTATGAASDWGQFPEAYFTMQDVLQRG